MGIKRVRTFLKWREERGIERPYLSVRTFLKWRERERKREDLPERERKREDLPERERKREDLPLEG